MTPTEYVNTVIYEGNKVLTGTDFEIVCVMNELSARPDTAKFLAEHFSLVMPGVADSNEALINETTKKMELVFKKVRKS